MAQDSTITSARAGELVDAGPANARPQLVLVAISDEPSAPSSRHLLDDLDEVRFGRGEREARRVTIDGRRVLQLRIPDRRMSSAHGVLARGRSGWVLDDPHSKNGAVVDGAVTRRAAIGDGALIELGHCFFVFRNAPVEPGAALDVDDAGLRAGAAALRTFDGVLAERFALLERVAATEVSVLLQGETGTGKELVARALHELSGRAGALIPVNCGALPQNLIEAELFGYRRGAFTGAVGERVGLVRSADGGTLFLDEVGELPAASQAAFLRVLQEREVVPVGSDQPVKVDVRLCSATLRDLEVLVASGRFRRDLYGRLFGLTVELVPLRHRRVDLGLLVRSMLAAIEATRAALPASGAPAGRAVPTPRDPAAPPGPGSQVRFAPAALRALLRHDWPLNIRELEKVLTTAVALAADGVIEAAHLPDAVRQGPRGEPAPPPAPGAPDLAAPRAVRSTDDELREQLGSLLRVHEGNVVAVAKVLGVRRTQVYRWLHRFEIDVETFRRKPPREN